MTDFSTFTQLIRDHQIITIFRHSRPDCDASGSQFGLKNWIEENFPDKTVLAAGEETCSQGSFPSSDPVDEELIRRSIAFVLDTANTDRIDDRRALQAKLLIKIDHHPDREPFGDFSYVDPEAADVCQILTEWLSSEKDYKLSDKTAEYLYSGLLTDTLCFRTSNTTAATLKAAATLADTGIDIPGINRELFDVSVNEFNFGNYIRTHAELCDNAAILVLNKNELAQWQISGSDARNHIDEIGHIREMKVWALFTETADGGMYDGSLRSKYAAVNEIASRYNGGGHRNAAGVKNLTPQQLNEIITELRNAARS